MPELPSGTVTFLFTDIEGSTARWEHRPEAMADALARHDTLLRAAIREHGGHVVKTTGDGFHAVFAHAPDALAAALASQRRLAAEPWGEAGPIRVRIALHTGAAEERDGDYYGSPLNRAARLLATGHGGQVLLSEATAGLVRDALPDGVRLLDLGRHRLKDLIEPEQVSQAVAPDLASDFPPLASLDARPHNLPTHPTALLGRERELADVRGLFEVGARLVTLTGPGGTGKTRLGLQVAADLLDAFEHGVFLVDLAPISDPALVPSTIAQALGVRDIGSHPIVDALKEHLRSRSVLLLLDNFEQVLAAASVMADLLAACPGLAVLATSREPLRLRGEQEYAVPPLMLPEAGPVRTAEAVSRSPAVALFVQRARSIRADFALTDENAPTVAEVCVRLDGLPLAIELAAARVRLLTPEAMTARLERRLPLLVGGASDLPARQRTLRDAIAWSHDLLDEPERRMFRRLGVFVGGCTLEAAEAVCDAGGDLGTDVLDGVASLVAKSLVRETGGVGGEPRFGMLETIREYALEQLEESGEAEAARRAHAVFFLGVAQAAEPELYGPEQVAWLLRLDGEYGNLRAVLDRSRIGEAPVDLGLLLVGSLHGFWSKRGVLRESRDRLAALLGAPGAEARTVGRARALWHAAWLASFQADYETGRSLAEESVGIFRENNDLRGVGRALVTQALAEIGRGNRPVARSLLEESVALARQAGTPHDLAIALGNLGGVVQGEGDYAAATAMRGEAAVIARKIGDRESLGTALAGLAFLARMRGHDEESAALWREDLVVSSEIGHRWIILRALAGLAGVACLAGDHARAARLFGAVAALREADGSREIPGWRDINDRAEAAARAGLGDDTFAAAWAEGRAMTLEQAVAYALDNQSYV